jgi:hypothetical protein
MASRNFPGPGVLVSSLVVLAGLAAAGATAQEREAVPPANQSATPQLSIVSGQSGFDLGTFPSSASTFDQTFKIQSDDGAAASGLKVEAAFVSGPEGVAPDAAAPRLNGQQGALDLGALQGDETQDIAFTASLPRPGDYEFTLRLISPERRSYRFKVMRPAPVLSVVEAQGDTITLDTNSAGLRRALHLKTDTEVPAEAVSVRMPELIGPNGRSVPLVSPAPNQTSFDKIAGNQTVTFNIATSADGTDTALSESGSYRGTLEIDFLGGQKTYAVTVERTAPTLTIAEANGDTITLDTDSASFKRSLHLRTDPALPAQEVTVSMPELIGPGGRSVALAAPAPNGVAFNEIAGNQTRTFDIETKLPETGDYRGTLVITYIGGQKTYAVTITRSLANASIAPTSTGTGRATMPFNGDATVALHVTLRENEGNSVRINKPAFTELKRQIGDVTDISAVYSGAQFFDKANGSIDSWPLVLEPLEAEDLRVMIEGLGQPGSYSGKLLFSANDRGAVEVPVSFQLKRSWVWAGLAIVAGVVLSWFLRLWATTWRPRMIQVRKVLASVRNVDDVALAFEPLQTEEAELFTRMRGLLARANDGLRDGTATSADAVIASTKRKLALQPQWIARNRQIGALPADGRVEPLRQELAAVRDYLMTADPATEEAAHGDAKTTIENLRTKITDLVRTLFADFQSEIVALGDDLDDELRHGRWTDDVVDVLSAARDALDREDIAGAGAKIEEARKSAARILAQDLKKVLPPDEPPPDWLRQPIFKRIQNALVDADR